MSAIFPPRSMSLSQSLSLLSTRKVGTNNSTNNEQQHNNDYYGEDEAGVGAEEAQYSRSNNNNNAPRMVDQMRQQRNISTLPRRLLVADGKPRPRRQEAKFKTLPAIPAAAEGDVDADADADAEIIGTRASQLKSIIDTRSSSLAAANGPKAKSTHPRPTPTPTPASADFLSRPEHSIISPSASTRNHTLPRAFASTGTFPTDTDSSKSVMENRAAQNKANHTHNHTYREKGYPGARSYADDTCVLCDEKLQHTLAREQILPLRCDHLAHEACLYEYLSEGADDEQRCPQCNAPLEIDSSRGRSININKLLSAVRHHPVDAEQNSLTSQPLASPRTHRTAETPHATLPPTPTTLHRHHHSETLNALSRPPRSASAAAGIFADAGLKESRAVPEQRHDHDAASLTLSTATSDKPAEHLKNPIPPPIVHVRSEYPSVTRSRESQSFTCLVTVEVQQGKWRPNIQDLQPLRRIPETLSAESNESEDEDSLDSLMDEQMEETAEDLERIAVQLYERVDNWHGLRFAKFGPLHVCGKLHVGKERHSWQQLDCYLFSNMLICVKEKRPPGANDWYNAAGTMKYSLKGSIMLNRHLDRVEASSDNILTLHLTADGLPNFHILFQDDRQLAEWQREFEAIMSPNRSNSGLHHKDGLRGRHTESMDHQRRVSNTSKRLSAPLHVPVDLVAVIPVSAPMHGLKLSLLQDTMRFLVQSLGPKDRLGLVTYGGPEGTQAVTTLAGKSWPGWGRTIDSVHAEPQKGVQSDMIEGANVAMDLLMSRTAVNPIASILVVSDSTTANTDTTTAKRHLDFAVSRAEAAKVSLYCFGLGSAHRPDTMIELSTRTKASYIYVKDWMGLRECVAGCVGSLQSTSHHNARLKLHLPEGVKARFKKISGALQVTKRAAGRDAEVVLGDLRFGDRRDVLVQLTIEPDPSSAETPPADAWDSLVSGLDALGGRADSPDSPASSIEESPLMQADLIYGDLLRGGAVSQLAHPSLLTVTFTAPSRLRSHGRTPSPPVPANAAVRQRRMELLTSEMLTRALTLVNQGQHERAHHLLRETRNIMRGIGKGGLPAVPTTPLSPPKPPPNSRLPPPPNSAPPATNPDTSHLPIHPAFLDRKTTPTPPPHSVPSSISSVSWDDPTMSALDAELEAAVEWINHPSVFNRDNKKAVLQAIGIISSQRAYTFRTGLEALWAQRINGTKRLVEASRHWREYGEEHIEHAAV